MTKIIVKNRNVRVKAQVPGKERYFFRLFITGNLPNSAHAVINIKALCETYLKERYELEIIDIYQQPSLAITEGIVVVPFLIKKFPLPEKTLIGDLSNLEIVLKELHIK